ncbi:sensor domain-containing protein [Streptomyces sp. P5-A9]|uniref:sensor domain-containing protein n=1 Tax=Streptomyces sp. P5-A9 TaxID=3071730 RepID=UPI002FCA497B
MGGFGTALLALAVTVLLVATAAVCLVGAGLPVAPAALRVLHALAGRERARLGRQVSTSPPHTTTAHTTAGRPRRCSHRP